MNTIQHKYVIPIGGWLRNKMSNKIGLISLFVLIAAFFATISARVAYVRSSEIVLDEFQHLHSTYLVALGQTPYLQFFEHHTPLFYYFGSVFLPLDNPSFDTIIVARYFALIMSFVTLFLCVVCVGKSIGWLEGFASAILLLADFFLFSTGTLSYLDTYATPCLLGSAWFLSVSKRSPRRACASAFLLGVAILFTQKAVVFSLAPLFYYICRLWSATQQRGEIRILIKELIAYLVGVLASVLMLASLLGVSAIPAFFQQTVLLNLRWKARHLPLEEIATLIVNNGAVYMLAIVGAIFQLIDIAKRRGDIRPWDVAVFYFVAGIVGALFIPVVFEEYFIQVIPFAIMIAAVLVVSWVRDGIFHSWPMASQATFIAVVVVVVMEYLVHLFVVPFSHPILTSIGMFALWMLLASVFLQNAYRSLFLNIVLYTAAISVVPFVRQFEFLNRKTNQFQRERIDYVMSYTNPSDSVFDGYRGYGVFRPHAYKYWFLHDEVQMMLSDEEKSRDIIRALETRLPKIVIVDKYITALPQEVKDYIAKYYVTTRYSDLKIRRL